MSLRIYQLFLGLQISGDYMLFFSFWLLHVTDGKTICAAITAETAVQFSRSIMSDSLWPHGLQHTRPPCPSSTPRVYSNSCPSSGWCHPTVSSSVIPFSSHLQSFPTSESFQMSQFFASAGHCCARCPNPQVGKREGFQDNATHKKGSLLLTRVRAPAATNTVVQGQRAPSPSCYTSL